MTHEEIRELLSESGGGVATVTDHLETCSECRTWAQGLERVREAARSLYAETPSGLADRVMTAVRTAPPVEIAPVVELDLWRRLGGRMAVAAALIVAVVAGAMMIPDDEPVLVAAAKRTTEEGSARIGVASSFSFRPNDPIVIPLASAAQIRTSAEVRGLPASLRARLRALAQLPQPQRQPRLASVTSRVRASGVVAFDGRVHLTGSTTQSGAGVRSSGSFETYVASDRTWMRTRVLRDSWVRVPSFSGDIVVDFNPTTWLDQIESHGATATEVSAESGMTRYRFRTRNDFGAQVGTVNVKVDVWVGVSDGRVHRVVHFFNGRTQGGTVRARTTISFSGFGTDLLVQIPSESQETRVDATVAAQMGYGFGVAGPSVRVSLEAAGTMPSVRFPEIDLPDLKFEPPTFQIPRIELPDLSFELPEMPSVDLDFDFEAPSRP